MDNQKWQQIMLPVRTLVRCSWSSWDGAIYKPVILYIRFKFFFPPYSVLPNHKSSKPFWLYCWFGFCIILKAECCVLGKNRNTWWLETVRVPLCVAKYIQNKWHSTCTNKNLDKLKRQLQRSLNMIPIGKSECSALFENFQGCTGRLEKNQFIII